MSVKEKKESQYTVDYKDFAVTYETVDKYHPVTRTVQIKATDELSARNIVNNLYDSFKWEKDSKTQIPVKIATGKHITIKKVKKIKNKEEVA